MYRGFDADAMNLFEDIIFLHHLDFEFQRSKIPNRYDFAARLVVPLKARLSFHFSDMLSQFAVP